jgi:hypothetical protein
MSRINVRNLIRKNDFSTADGLHTSFERVQTFLKKLPVVIKHGSTYVAMLTVKTEEHGVLKNCIPPMKSSYTP